MPYYLAPYIGVGTKADPRRPRGADDAAAWGSVDLAPILGRAYALLYTSVPVSGTGIITLGADATARPSTTTRNQLMDTLGQPRVAAADLQDLLGGLVAAALQPIGSLRHLHLGPLHWTQNVIAGGGPDDEETAIYELWRAVGLSPHDAATLAVARRWPIRGGAVLASDTFNRANETPLASPWVRNSGGSQNINLVSNAVQSSNAGDKFYYYSGPTWGADQYSQAVQVTAPTDEDWGPGARIGAASGLSGYIAVPYGGSAKLTKFVSGVFAEITSVGAVTFVDGDTLRLEAQGSTVRWIRNGGAPATSGTDTSLTTAGNGAGIFIYATGGAIDNWEGGDFAAAGATSLIWRQATMAAHYGR